MHFCRCVRYYASAGSRGGHGISVRVQKAILHFLLSYFIVLPHYHIQTHYYNVSVQLRERIVQTGCALSSRAQSGVGLEKQWQQWPLAL